MPAETAPAPRTFCACEIDLTHHSLADQADIIGSYNFRDEFMTRYSGESIIAALKFEIGVADPAEKHPEQREALRPFRDWNFLKPDAAVLQMN